MQRKKHQRGFTLIELIIVIAILAILAAILVPMMISYINEAQTTTCNYNTAAIERSYLNYYALATSKSNTVDTGAILTETLAKDYPSATLSGSKITGVCPSGGDYTCTIEQDGTLSITCSKHAKKSDPAQTYKDYSDSLLGLDSVAAYFKNYGVGISLDSSAFKSSTVAGTGTLVKQELAAKLGVNLDDSSFRIVKTDKNGNYSVYWTDKDVNTLSPGETVTTYYYDTKTGNMVTGTANVKKATTYNIIDNSTFKAA